MTQEKKKRILELVKLIQDEINVFDLKRKALDKAVQKRISEIAGIQKVQASATHRSKSVYTDIMEKDKKVKPLPNGAQNGIRKNAQRQPSNEKNIKKKVKPRAQSEKRRKSDFKPTIIPI